MAHYYKNSLSTFDNSTKYFFFQYSIQVCAICIKLLTTVVPAKSDIDVMFCLQSYQGHRLDISLCIHPIRRIGLIHNVISIRISSS